jgi:O-acetylserine/cysteine efflux transporter
VHPRHIALALGLNFVVITVALSDFPPMLLGAIRFAITALPVLFLARPKTPLGQLLPISLTLFVGQFALLLPAMKIGMPPGIASILVQVQAFFTIGIAAVMLREIPSPRQIAGAAIALGGLGVVATTTGADGVTFWGFALAVGSAVLWAIGNVLLRAARVSDVTSTTAWMALMAFPSLLVLSFVFDGPAAIGTALNHATWLTAGSAAYIAIASTIFGYWVWGRLLQLYPAAMVAPFTLLVPVSGTLSAALLLGESFGPVRLAGMALILAGLAVLVVRIPRGR